MRLDRALESLRAAELCLAEQLVNSAASRAYYAMFQAAQVALRVADVGRADWSHGALQAAFVTELIRRRKVYPAVFADYLSSGLHLRQLADYGSAGVGQRVAQRLLRRAETLVAAVAKEVGDESRAR
jgi:uncharacterized protein (UPF0332 family)